MKLEQSGDTTVRHEVVFPQASALAEILLRAVAGVSGATLAQIQSTLSQLIEEVGTVATNQEQLAALVAGLQQIETAEEADITAVQGLLAANTTAIGALNATIAQGTVDAATLQTLTSVRDLFDKNNQTLAALAPAPAPAPATTPAPGTATP